MFNELKTKLDIELKNLIGYIDKKYSFKEILPPLYKSIKNFILRDGKRLRPILFIMSYRGFSHKNPRNLLRSALAIELLHDFLLIHDDIIDKSALRRGEPSMHYMLKKYIPKNKGLRFGGEDLAIVAGDIIFSIAVESFLSVKENPLRKEKALLKFIESASYTGCGEFIEIMYTAASLDKIRKDAIYRIYDYKTAYYTFAAPLAAGAILAGAPEKETEKLFSYGIYLGRAFQIKDDILGIFEDDKKTGKPGMSDIQEAKKTLLIWRAYKKASSKDKLHIKRILNKKNAGKKDLIAIRKIIKKTGSLKYAKEETKRFFRESIKLIKASRMEQPYKDELIKYSSNIVGI